MKTIQYRDSRPMNSKIKNIKTEDMSIKSLGFQKYMISIESRIILKFLESTYIFIQNLFMEWNPLQAR